jgi:hypothetical protein
MSAYRCPCCLLPAGQCKDHEFDQEMDRIARDKGYENDYERMRAECDEAADEAFVRALEAIPVMGNGCPLKAPAAGSDLSLGTEPAVPTIPEDKP